MRRRALPCGERKVEWSGVERRARRAEPHRLDAVRRGVAPDEQIDPVSPGDRDGIAVADRRSRLSERSECESEDDEQAHVRSPEKELGSGDGLAKALPPGKVPENGAR